MMALSTFRLAGSSATANRSTTFLVCAGRKWWLAVSLALIGVGCLWTCTAQAGVYSTLEPKWPLSAEYFRKFQEESLTPLKQLASPEAKADWQKFYLLAANAALWAKDPLPALKPDSPESEQRLNMSTCLLRNREPGKGMPEKAIALLENLTRKEHDNFLASSTLATAYQMTGFYDRANTYHSEAFRHGWSQPFDKLSAKRRHFIQETLKWKAEDFAWYAKCEKYHWQLLKLHYKELTKGPITFSKAMERLDGLFDADAPSGKPIRFVGDSGNFEPGKMAEAEKAKLPSDAIEVVEQLLIWMPDDLRLFWQLGELFNAKGDVESAKIIFNEFLGKFSQMPEFQGLAIVDPKTQSATVDPMALLPKFIERHPHVGNRLKALRDYTPPPPELGGLAKDVPTENSSSTSSGKSDDPAVIAAPLNLDWQTLVVGLGSGALIGFITCWRLRDILRRRQQMALHSAHRPPPARKTRNKNC